MPRVECKVCGKEFYVKSTYQKVGWGKYCSISCRNTSQLRGKKVSCQNCNKEIYRSLADIRHSKSGNSFCCKSCYFKWRNKGYTQEKHPNWKNGINSYRVMLMRSGREKVCICCNISDIRILAAHHVDHNRENNKLSNLVWVCLNCHYLIHHDQIFEENLKNKLNI
jgi:hypothetical protein